MKLRRRFAVAAVAGAGLFFAAAPAAACINDRDTVRHEQEFKSHYNKPATPTPQTRPDGEAAPAEGGGHNLLLASAGVAIGGVLAIGAVIITLGIGRKSGAEG